MPTSRKPRCRHVPRCPLFAGDRVASASKQYSLPKRRLCRTSDDTVRSILARYHRQAHTAADKLPAKRYKRWQRIYFAVIGEANRRRLR